MRWPVLAASQHFLVARRRAAARGLSAGPELCAAAFSAAIFCSWSGGHEAVQCQRPRYLGQRGQPLGGGIGLLERRRQQFGIVAAGFGVLLQLTIGQHRRRGRAPQVDRIEIERQVKQQRRAGERHEKRARDDRYAMPLQ